MALVTFNCNCCGREWQSKQNRKGPRYCAPCIEFQRRLGLTERQQAKKAAVAEPQQWYTINEAAIHLRLSRRTIYQLVNEGHLTSNRVRGKGHQRFKRQDLDSIMVPEDTMQPQELTAGDDPVLAELWDNERDAAYDRV